MERYFLPFLWNNNWYPNEPSSEDDGNEYDQSNDESSDEIDIKGIQVETMMTDIQNAQEDNTEDGGSNLN